MNDKRPVITCEQRHIFRDTSPAVHEGDLFFSPLLLPLAFMSRRLTLELEHNCPRTNEPPFPLAPPRLVRN